MENKNGVKCCISNCQRSYRTDDNVRMFNFPAGDTPMGHIWRQKCNIDSEIAQTKLKICDIHFEPSDIGKKFLKRHAEPMHFLDSDTEYINANIFVEPVLAAENTARQSCEYCAQQAKNAKFYLKKIAQMNKMHKKQQMKINSLKKQLAKMKVCEQIESVKNISEESKTFAKMLVRARQNSKTTLRRNQELRTKKSAVSLMNV